jgi:hypothetical protein
MIAFDLPPRVPHVERIRALRADIDKGIRSLDDGKGIVLNIEEFIREKNAERRGPSEA